MCLLLHDPADRQLGQKAMHAIDMSFKKSLASVLIDNICASSRNSHVGGKLFEKEKRIYQKSSVYKVTFVKSGAIFEP